VDRAEGLSVRAVCEARRVSRSKPLRAWGRRECLVACKEDVVLPWTQGRRFPNL